MRKQNFENVTNDEQAEMKVPGVSFSQVVVI